MARDFCLLQSDQTDSTLHPTSYTMGTADSFPEGKAMGREVSHSHLIPTLRMGGAIPLLSLYAYIACTRTFTFTFTQAIACWDSEVGIGTRYRLQSPGAGSRLGRDFPCPSRPAVGPTHLLLYNTYQASPGLERPRRGVDYPHLRSAEVKERVEL